MLETAIKFNLTPTLTLAEHFELEAQLLRQSRLYWPFVPAPTHPQHKPLAVIGHLRRLADVLNSGCSSIAEYYEGLLLTTLNLLRFDFMRQHHPRILLSAAMVCQGLAGRPQIV